jgi:hypothetical protein
VIPRTLQTGLIYISYLFFCTGAKFRPSD